MFLVNFILFFVVPIFSLLYFFIRQRYSYWQNKNVPHDPPKFPLGNLSGLGSKYHVSELTTRAYNKYKGKDKIAGLYFFIRPVALVMDIELVKSILIKDFHNFDDRGVYYNEKDEPLSAHLFSLEAEKWKPLRNKLSPTFTSGKMKFTFSTIIEVADRFRDCVNTTIDKEGETIEIKELLARFTTDVIGSCAFGVECDSLNNPNSEFRKKGKAVFEKTRYPALIMALMQGLKGPANKLHMKTFPNDVTEFFMNVVVQNIAYRKSNKVIRNDFMDILIKLQDEGMLTTNEIAAQAFVFFLAGFETSSTTMNFCLYELAQLSEVQEEIRQNVREVLKKYNNELTYEAMMEMHLVEQAINETLRMYPPVANLIRKAKNDYKVPGTDHVLEKGTSLFIPAFTIQRDPEYYPEPEKFKIERFTQEEVAKRGTGKWLPFGDGPRNCIGLRFGMMQARVGLAMLLNNFEFTLSEKTLLPIKFNPKVSILSSGSPIYLKLRKINFKY